MLSFAKNADPCPAMNKSVRSAEPKLPGSALLWDVLRGVEVQFQKKGLLSPPAPSSFNPFWFIAETERNVFLWQRGCSLSDMDRFEFWIDVPRLIQKRLRQLEKGDAANPFTNPHWGEQPCDPSFAQGECEYLEQLQELILQLGAHAHALSVIGSAVQRELQGVRERVLLPGARPRMETVPPLAS